MQAVGERVEVGESGRHAGQRAAPAADGLDLVQRAGHDLRQLGVVLGDPPVGDAVDLGLGPVHQLVGVTVARVAELDDPGPDLDQAAQDGPLPDDAGVVAGVGGGGHGGDERVQVGRAAHAADVAAPGQLGGDGDGIGGLAAPVQVEDDLVDDLVRGPVVVGALDDVEDIGDGVLGQQHAAEHALLGGDVIRRRALELAAAAVRHDLRHAHRRTSPCPSPYQPANSPQPPGGDLRPFYRTVRTVSRSTRRAANRSVHRPVDRLCRHAVDTVRSMGTSLWISPGKHHQRRDSLRKCPPPAVQNKNFSEPGRGPMARSYPHWELNVEREVSGLSAGQAGHPDLRKRRAARGRAPYGSSMCSNPGGRCAQPSGGTGQEDLDRLGEAIDGLADAARADAASAQELAGRLAEVWEMVAELDPELARRLAGYDR